MRGDYKGRTIFKMAALHLTSSMKEYDILRYTKQATKFRMTKVRCENCAKCNKEPKNFAYVNMHE